MRKFLLFVLILVIAFSGFLYLSGWRIELKRPGGQENLISKIFQPIMEYMGWPKGTESEKKVTSKTGNEMEGKGREGHETLKTAEYEEHGTPKAPETAEHQRHEGIKAGVLENKDKKILYWVDPMHPQYKSDKPGIAPDCGIKLVPVYAEEEETEEEMPPGTVRISPQRQQIAGVRIGLVEFRPLRKIVRTVGLLEVDETQIRHIHTKISGWVEKIYVNYTGQLVEKGTPLVSIYSPELVSTQQEYLLALKARSYLGKSPFGEVSSGANSLFESTRNRLLLWDITPQQVRELEKRGEPMKTLTLYSPIKGFVTRRDTYEGKYVMPENPLYSITDLSHMWVHADIYEYEIPFIRVDQKATIKLSYHPGEVFSGKVIYIYPYLEEKTRTNKVRMEFHNPDYKLKPGMYSNVEIEVNLGNRLVVPEDAVMDSGDEKIVFLAKDDGHFEPRQVRLGAELDGYYEVLEGLVSGDRIVTSANFLIDSESKLKAALGVMEHKGH